MIDFQHKFPGLSKEEALFRYKLWIKERDNEKKILEALKRKLPFTSKEDDDTAGYDDSLFGSNFGFAGGDSVQHGVVSDAAISGAELTFLYKDGTVKTTTTNHTGEFTVPDDFTEGDIISKGGIDTVTGFPFNGEFIVDAEFFFKYKAITPLTHVANFIWNNTDTRTPEEALDLVLGSFPEFIGISISSIDKDAVFNNDHVRLTLEGIDGAKEVQCINTLLEVYAELIGSTEANLEEEIPENKKRVYNEISISLLEKINNNDSSKHSLELHHSSVEETHKECCRDLINRAHSMIYDTLNLDSVGSTTTIQAINLIVKAEWAKKALEMTSNSKSNKTSVWKEIENKVPGNLLFNMKLPTL